MISSVDRRSEYVENRAGANVRLNNFLTPYTLDDKSSILNAPCGYSNGVYPSLRPVQTFGPELIVNGDLASGTSPFQGYQCNLSNVNNTLVATATSANDSRVRQAITTVSGRSYKITADLLSLSGTKVGVTNTDGSSFSYSGDNNERTTSGQFTFFFTAQSTTTSIVFKMFDASIGESFSLDNISVKEVTDADFDFTRGSAATRVTKDGLVKNVQILSDELVQNGNFEEIGPEEVTNGDFSQIGSELITNGDFSDSSWWGLDPVWSISGGSANCNGSGVIYKGGVLTIGKTYKVQVEISSYTSGTLIYPNAPYTLPSAVGSYTFYYKANSQTVSFTGTNFIGSIDNVSVKEVGQDWGFSGESELTSEGARVYSSDGSYTAIEQPSVLTSGKQYKITFDVVSTNGSNLANPSGTFIYDTSTVGSKVFYLKANTSVFQLKRASGVTDVTVANISVKEVGQNWTVNTGWSIGDGVAIGNASIGTGSIYQQGVFEIGKKYQLKLDATLTSGSFKLEGSGGSTLATFNETKSYDVTIEATQVDLMFRRITSSFIGSIDNVSVIEITDDTDLPRIDYTNGTGSLLLEPQSTNTATYSNDFTQGDIFNGSGNPGTTNAVLTSQQITAPDGTNNGWLLKDNNDSGSGRSYLQYFSTRVNSDDFNTISIFAKKALSNDFLILENVGYDADGTGISFFNISNGSLANISANHTAKIEDYGDGWYRCSITFQTTTDLQGAIYVRLASSSSTVNITRDGTNGVYIFGIQCEADDSRKFATSYIPTSGSTVTRNADVCNNAGSSDLINSTEGVLYAEISALADDGTKRYISLSDGSNSNDVRLYFDTGGYISALTKVGGSTQAFLQTNAYTQTNFNKIAFKFKENNFSLYVNGIEVATDNLGSVNTANTLNQLAFFGNLLPFYGNVRSVAVFKEALTDEELAKITSTTQQEAFYEMRDKMLQIDADYYEFGDYTTRLKKLF